jgi:hypothetical protein
VWGLIEARTAIQQYIVDLLGEDYWMVMRDYHRQTIRLGLNAAQPDANFLSQIVELAEEGLRRRGQGEEVFLEAIHDRLFRRENPAQRARRIFLTDGMAGLIAHTAIRPSMVADA